MRLTAFALALAAGAWLPGAHGAEDHTHHQRQPAGYTRGTVRVVLPAVTVQRADGKRVKLAAEIDDIKPTLINFIFTTCTAICPPMTQVFAEFQQKLGAKAADVHMISVSIDPEQDTPARLTAYAQRFGAGPQWTFLTGSAEASVAVQKAFGAYRSDKMSHTPTTWLRAAPGQPWLRLDGFATPDELLREYRQLVAAAQ